MSALLEEESNDSTAINNDSDNQALVNTSGENQHEDDNDELDEEALASMLEAASDLEGRNRKK